MSARNCVVIVQSRKDSAYNDFVGKFYHFPRKYLNLLSKPNLEFVYYEPKNSDNNGGVYFGYGKIGKIFEDKREADHYFAEILEYKCFSAEVPFKDDKDKPRETPPTYNAQNSVRVVLPEVLDEISLDGGIILNFVADAHLIKVLGEELISSEVVGVLELIKNAYDANASYCKVRIEKLPNFPALTTVDCLFPDLDGPIIIIEDDGNGMDRHTIEYGWLRPASTIKTDTKEILKRERSKAMKSGKLGEYESLVAELKIHHGGRIPLGEKGVGRFATHRLGRKVIIKSKTSTDDYEYVFKIDWDLFDKKENGASVDLSSIGLSLTRQKPTRDYGKRNSGTQIIIYGGREGYEFTREILDEINSSILKLRSPRPSSQCFQSIFECPQVTDFDETSISDEFDPIFSLIALVDEHGYADLKLEFAPPKSVPLPPEILEDKKYCLCIAENDSSGERYWLDKETGKNRDPQCGSFFIHIDFWYRSKPWIEGTNVKSFTNYLDKYGGISIFRDGLNIFSSSWGSEVDWLDLSKRHIKKGLNISYYNMIGEIELDQTINVDLTDKTDRQGMLAKTPYRDLTKLVRNLVFYVENPFRAKRESFEALTAGLIREPKKLREVSQMGALLTDNILKRYDIVNDENEILLNFGDPESRQKRLLNLKDSLKNLGKSLDVMQDVQDMLTEQAGYGLAIGVAVHEVAKITSNFYHGVVKILKSKTPDPQELERLKETATSLKTEINRFGPYRAIRNESSVEFDIAKPIRFCYEVFKERLEKSSITFEVSRRDNFKVYARYGALVQIISNLMDNSCYWLEMSQNNDKRIILEVNANDRTLIFADTGPDIDDSIRPYLFEPGYSLRVPPSGLGLHICKYYMRSMKANIYEAGKKDRIPDVSGAQFILDFSRVAEEKGGK